MAWTSGTAAATGLGGQHNLVVALKAFLEGTPGWVSQRYVETVTTDGATREQIYKAPGLSGIEEIYVGFIANRNVAADIYNFYISGFTGYISGNPWSGQPSKLINEPQIPMWNSAIDYYFVANGQRCIILTKINNIWVCGYFGKYLPYATPGQYPYPLYVGGMYTGSRIRYDNIGQVAFFKGGTIANYMRFVDGNWRQPQIFPYAGARILRNTKSVSTNTEVVEPGYWGLHPLVLSENTTGYVNNYGELDGLYYISGFSNAIGNIVTLSGINYFIFSDFGRLGLKDFAALKLE